MHSSSPGSSLSVPRITILASLIALSVVGSYLKIPSPTGTVALDAVPGYLGGLYLGFGEGAIIAFLGHILTSLNVGFPLGLPIHLLIGAEMALIVAVFRLVYLRWSYLPAIAIAVFLNGVIAPLTMVPLFGWGFFTAIILSLVVSSAANAMLACAIYRLLLKKNG
ncbi:MAG TPA: ECF transporter S component [Atribacteraceae bacterium]|nr:ECF transporter S component [Atribacteraceae bacterium]